MPDVDAPPPPPLPDPPAPPPEAPPTTEGPAPDAPPLEDDPAEEAPAEPSADDAANDTSAVVDVAAEAPPEDPGAPVDTGEDPAIDDVATEAPAEKDVADEDTTTAEPMSSSSTAAPEGDDTVDPGAPAAVPEPEDVDDLPEPEFVEPGPDPTGPEPVEPEPTPEVRESLDTTRAELDERREDGRTGPPTDEPSPVGPMMPVALAGPADAPVDRTADRRGLDPDRATELLESGFDTPGGKAFYGEGDPLGEAAQRLPAVEGTRTYDLHGEPTRVYLGEQPLDAHEFADVVRQDPGWNGEPITLFSCETGKTPADGGDCFAQQLSNDLGVPVHAPTELAWSNGAPFVTSATRDSLGIPTPSFPLDGEMRTFSPNGPAGGDVRPDTPRFDGTDGVGDDRSQGDLRLISILPKESRS